MKEPKNDFVFSPFTFRSQRLFIVTSGGYKYGPVFINDSDKKLYIQHKSADMSKFPTLANLSFTTDTSVLVDSQGRPVTFTYSELHHDISCY